ncbi:hypothetical protein TUM19329_01980 [Legionella antarctica]|uniref:Dot/Icm T4SS effector n=1 Tax=Legionella antarctica TaxID=2708020 RepID=A0A6F8T0Z0_9GAMM|nr:hypothetical protein [Legionella antarctica]BCA93837.1 hypothetical protein TUM19329_01980 [Legionella antarctica]
MKQLVAIIKAQIHQLNNLQLNEWLLNHLNEDANHLNELFTRQLPALSNHVVRIPSFTNQVSPYLSLLSIIFVYAPEALRDALEDRFLAFPELLCADKSIDDTKMNQELQNQLITYRRAWPIIVALQKQGGNDLIQILNNTDEHALMSFASLTKGNGLAILVDTFLAKNSKDLELIDRNSLIHFLRQPDLTSWLNNLLESLVFQASNTMALKLLNVIFTPYANELKKAAEIKTLLADNPFAIHLETIQAIIYFYYSKLKKDPISVEGGAYISLLYDLIKREDLTSQREMMLSLEQDCLFFMIEQCLQRMTSSDLTLQQICRELLFLLCSEPVKTNKQYRGLIKTRLEQPDRCLFDTVELFVLAKEILLGNDSASENAFCNLWIEPLLTSPRFIAASTTKVLKQLSDRYHALITILGKEEYRCLTGSFKKYLWHDNETRTEFRGERFVPALWMRLERICEQQKATDVELAEKALRVLYRYYAQTLPNLRTDLLLRMIDYAYRPKMDDRTERNKQRNVLLFWFKKYAPQHPLAQAEWASNIEAPLYCPRRNKIGFVSESNEAMAFIKDKLVLLINSGLVSVNEPLYDEQGSIIGYLTESGQIRSTNLIQKNASAQLLARVPEHDLELSPSGLSLLIQNVLSEDTLDELYGSEHVLENSSKRYWLEHQISTVVQNAKFSIASKTFKSLVNYHSNETLFSLLATIKHKTSARFLFHAIFDDDQKREVLFRGNFVSDIDVFLVHFDAIVCLADYMARYHEKSWFADGLMCFASYGNKHKADSLLSNALAHINKKAAHEEQRSDLGDKVLKSLIGSEDSARVILQEFLHDRAQTPVQQLKSPEINKITQYVFKEHLMVALQLLNKNADWQNSSLYKLVLHILETQHEQIFPSDEFVHPAEMSWKKNELDDFACFISRHLSMKRSLDSDFSVGHRVLNELIFRGASAGQTSLFYSQKTFNKAIAQLSFPRVFLEQLVDKFWIPEGVKEQFADKVLRIKAWFDDQSPLQKELGNHPVLMDWRHLITQTWNEINKKKLPVICVYLLNYSGSKKPLSCLVRDYIATFQKTSEYLYPVVKLVHQFPQRDVSAVIFDVLEAMIIKNPLLLDETILHHMAFYYAIKNANREANFAKAELDLLIYFGQRKQYAVVQRGCDELAKNCEDQKLKKQLLKGSLEAEIETDLSSNLGHFYFSLVKVFKRLWHYGINAKKNSSGIVCFCDDVVPRPIIKRAPEEVKTPVLSGKVSSMYLDFNEKQKQLIRLLATIKHSPAPESLIARPSQISQSLFHGKGHEQETVVAQEQAVVHI